MTLYLWKISQTENSGYDTYDSAVVAAHSENYAKRIHPSEYCVGWGRIGDLETWVGRYAESAANGRGGQLYDFSGGEWASSPETVTAVLIGEAALGVSDGDVLCASFNAG